MERRKIKQVETYPLFYCLSEVKREKQLGLLKQESAK